jgi:hypothetical protein
MGDTKDKIISSQTIANDLLVKVSAIINQRNYNEEKLRMLHGRMKDLSAMLNDIDTRDAEF